MNKLSTLVATLVLFATGVFAWLTLDLKPTDMVDAFLLNVIKFTTVLSGLLLAFQAWVLSANFIADWQIKRLTNRFIDKEGAHE